MTISLVQPTIGSTNWGSTVNSNFSTIQSALNRPAARYVTIAGQSIAISTYTIINFDTKDYDTQSSVTTGTSWNFSCPTTGIYAVKSFLTFNLAALVAGSVIDILLFHNGSFHSFLNQQRTVASITTDASVCGSSDVSASSGDTLSLWTWQNHASPMTLSTAGQSWVALAQIA